MSSITKEDAERLQQRVNGKKREVDGVPMKGRANLKPRDRGMNKTEALYSQRLETMKRNGVIVDWRFEPVKFRLADHTTYTPDFMVIDIDGAVVFTDTKAYWKSAGKVGIEEDANVKLKVVAEQYPWFSFCIAYVKDGRWQFKHY